MPGVFGFFSRARTRLARVRPQSVRPLRAADPGPRCCRRRRRRSRVGQDGWRRGRGEAAVMPDVQGGVPSLAATPGEPQTLNSNPNFKP